MRQTDADASIKKRLSQLVHKHLRPAGRRGEGVASAAASATREELEQTGKKPAAETGVTMTKSAASPSPLTIHDPREAQGPSRTCNESKEEEEDSHGSPTSPKNEAVFETLEHGDVACARVQDAANVVRPRHAQDHVDVGVQRQDDGPTRSKSLTWSATLTVEATFDYANFQRRSWPSTNGIYSVSSASTLGPEGVDGPPRSAKAAGCLAHKKPPPILRRARSCSLVSGDGKKAGKQAGDGKKAQLDSLLNGTAAIKMRTERLDRLLDQQILAEQAAERTEYTEPLLGGKVDVGATLTNVWDAVFVSPLLGLIGQTSEWAEKASSRPQLDDGEPPKAPSTPRYAPVQGYRKTPEREDEPISKDTFKAHRLLWHSA